MNNEDRIRDIFEQTGKIIRIWTGFGNKNPQIPHILNYLCLTACYLKKDGEAKSFQENWNKIKNNLKKGADEQDWLNQSQMINSHLEQAIREESVHDPEDDRNKGIKQFYEKNFPSLYFKAKTEYERFQKNQNEMVASMRKCY